MCDTHYPNPDNRAPSAPGGTSSTLADGPDLDGRPTTHRRRVLLFVIASAALALVATMLLPAPAAEASPPVPVHFTVAETLPTSVGALVAGAVPGCAAPDVYTDVTAGGTFGATTWFSGTKKLDCGGGDILEIAFEAEVTGCAPSSIGTWFVEGGSGAFTDAWGDGKLTGRYTLDGEPSNACEANAVLDAYDGYFAN